MHTGSTVSTSNPKPLRPARGTRERLRLMHNTSKTMRSGQPIRVGIESTFAEFLNKDVDRWNIAAVVRFSASRVQPSAGTGRESATGTRTEPSAGTGRESATGTRTEATAGTGRESATGTRTEATAGTGRESATGTRTEATARAGRKPAARTSGSSTAGAGAEAAARAGAEAATGTGGAIAWPTVVLRHDRHSIGVDGHVLKHAYRQPSGSSKYRCDVDPYRLRARGFHQWPVLPGESMDIAPEGTYPDFA